MSTITDMWQRALKASDGNYDTMHTWAGNGNAQRSYELNFTGGYISQSDVKAYMIERNTTNRVDLRVLFVNASTVRLNQAVPVGWDVTIYRDTPKDNPSASFVDGALITARNLDRNAKQAIFGVAEMVDRFLNTQANIDQALNIANDALALAGEAKDIAESAVSSSGSVARTIRAPVGDTLNELPSKELRNGKVVSFDSNGQLLLAAPATGSAADVMIQLRKSNGSSFIGIPYGTGSVDSAMKYLSFEMFGAVSGNTVDQTAAIQATVDAAKLTGLPIWSTGNYHIKGTVTIDFACKLSGFSLNGPANSTSQHLTVRGDVTLEWCKFERVYVYHGDGNLIMTDFQFTGVRYTAAILSEKLSQVGSLDLRSGTFRNCNFGILRQGSPASTQPLRYALMRNLQFYDMQSDCIEMNLGINDQYTLVEGVTIDNVDHLSTQPNWGIAMGFAGSGNYAITDDYTNFYKNLVIRNCRIYSARQCIHLEKCAGAIIQDCEIYPDNTKSVNAGIDPAGIVLYGCADITLKNITGKPLVGDRMIWVAWGVNGGNYNAAGRNISMENINVGGSIDINVSTTNAVRGFLTINGLRCDALSIVGHASEYNLKDIVATSGVIEFHRVNNNGTDNIRRTWRTACTIDNMQFRDANLNPNVTVGRIAADEMTVSNCNFTIRKTASSVTNRGTPVTKLDGIYYLEAAGFPYGYWFRPGDKIQDNTGKLFTITSEGAIFKAAGDTRVRAAAAGSRILQGMGSENWTTVLWKTAGVKIVIPRGGANAADLYTTIMQSAYIGGGIYTFQIADPLGTAISDDTIITPQLVCTYVENS
ncbi:tail protein [Escherichia phage vB_EcoP_LHP]